MSATCAAASLQSRVTVRLISRTTGSARPSFRTFSARRAVVIDECGMSGVLWGTTPHDASVFLSVCLSDSVQPRMLADKPMTPSQKPPSNSDSRKPWPCVMQVRYPYFSLPASGSEYNSGTTRWTTKNFSCFYQVFSTVAFRNWLRRQLEWNLPPCFKSVAALAKL